MILVTGGAGYIGAHITLQLLESGRDVVVLDNLCNSSRDALGRVERLGGRRLNFIHGDVRSKATLHRLFTRYPVEAVVHCAGLKAVGESVREPLRYFDTNVSGSVNLCQAMAEAGVFYLLFSSSATVYGDCERMPLDENCPLGLPTNPYGHSKLMAEHVMKSVAHSDPRWSIGLLRYFNPIGAHPSGLLGEVPCNTPNNLLPFLLQVANRLRPALHIFGNDYPTPDGTGVRDYLHVMDLADGHLKALDRIHSERGASVWNLGTGQGYSVLEVVSAFERISGKAVPLIYEPRRPGDVAACWSDPAKALRELQWSARLDLDSMLADAWRWQCMNPQGYAPTALVS
ncbi:MULTISPECIES: UDP-glucose 4-epimerase GalE [Pseudomonas syringae group]|uniref:UDP-glucose 4-epimerase n=2 Tax=Pseudomonas syringae group TaxID=136849 RepID=A0ABY1U6P0_PSESX|nr:MULTISPECIES: UDP-glucose 4-epimerase GalE [Pseudomonas syringae group]KWS99728.1 UDP-glucose 4-epimerase [Pseudomonas syringae pv. avii]PHN68559.1 UDP-glucose 4-epimerase [Pseudomonas syringae]POQ08525.1 UDP-glucose 4-epimerase GalE [Pseudomonas syringae pv. avii]RMR22297.1 UDP-glucose 4-epimerase [Pseudomonas syringae pv. persicae]SOQ09754.1 UDP-glucose 4-epimerase [Pseudomonas syringae pv. persicae]